MRACCPGGCRRRTGAPGIDPTPIVVWLTEIMLQQTTVAAVRDYFQRFTRRWPRVEDLAAAPLEDVLAAWAGLGYYARARNLHATARLVAGRNCGKFPQSAAEIAELPGIGPYTAAAIAAICHDERVPVVDGNVERVLARVLALDRPPRDAKHELRTRLAEIVPARAGDFAQALMDLGATLCAPRATACALCPLRPDCAAASLPDPTVYPVKAMKPERPTRLGHAYVMTRRRRRRLAGQAPGQRPSGEDDRRAGFRLAGGAGATRLSRAGALAESRFQSPMSSPISVSNSTSGTSRRRRSRPAPAGGACGATSPARPCPRCSGRCWRWYRAEASAIRRRRVPARGRDGAGERGRFAA